MKKEEMAKKMKKGSRKDNVEGDDSQHLGPEDKFSEKDERKEKKTRAEKHGKMPKRSWEI